MDPRALLGLAWLASPALPVGGYSYSEALESAVDAGHVHDERSTGNWLASQLQLTLARADAPLVAAACAAWRSHDAAHIADLNAWVRQTRESSELLLQTEQMGRSLLQWLRNGAASDDPRLATLAALQPAPCWPVAFALAAVQTGADDHAALLAFSFGWADNLVQAAMKAVPLGQAAAQRILQRLVDALPAVASAAIAAADDDRQAWAPMLAILSARHETQYSRLFRS